MDQRYLKLGFVFSAAVQEVLQVNLSLKGWAEDVNLCLFVYPFPSFVIISLSGVVDRVSLQFLSLFR